MNHEKVFFLKSKPEEKSRRRMNNERSDVENNTTESQSNE